MAKEKHYFGEFNRNGYLIWLCGVRITGDPVYQAGNCEYDSSQYLPIGAEGTIDLATIEEYCDSTGKEIAKENGGLWTGCTQVEDYEPADDIGDYEIDKAVGFDPDICGE